MTEKKQFDVVCAMEVIEHVDDPKGFLDCLSDLTKVCVFHTSAALSIGRD